MKNLFILAALAASLFFSPQLIAQEKAKTEIASVKKTGETVRFQLTSSKPFIFGNNRYVLYIGDKEFTLAEQIHNTGQERLSFLIPASEFSSLKEGDAIYLSYGRVDVQDEDMEQLSQGRRCWSLGKFTSALLK